MNHRGLPGDHHKSWKKGILSLYINWKQTIWCTGLFHWISILQLSFYVLLILCIFPCLVPDIYSCGDCEKLRLIYSSRCVVSPIGNVCVIAALRVLSKQMRIQHSWRPVWTLCRQAPAGSAKPPFNPCRFCHFHWVLPLIHHDCVFFLWWSFKWANNVALDLSMDVTHAICIWGYLGHCLCMSAMFATASMNDLNLKLIVS